jgi:DNA-directed RNA polymerase specialized sigma24 family protein
VDAGGLAGIPLGRRRPSAAAARRLARGEPDRLAELYDLTSPKLYGLILRIQRDRNLAEDVLQDVYMRVWQAAGSYRPNVGTPLAWLTTIARNRAIDSTSGWAP